MFFMTFIPHFCFDTHIMQVRDFTVSALLLLKIKEKKRKEMIVCSNGHYSINAVDIH